MKSKRKRESGINIRLTEQEKKRIKQYAKKVRLSVSEYLRKLANGYEPKVQPVDDFYKAIDELDELREFFNAVHEEQLESYVEKVVEHLRQRYVYQIDELQDIPRHGLYVRDLSPEDLKPHYYDENGVEFKVE